MFNSSQKIDFNQKYNRQKFLDFLYWFLPDDFVEDVEENIKTEKKFQKIKKIHRLGEVSSLGTNQPLKIYEIEHNSENDPRVTLTRDAFWLLSSESIRRALIVFVSKNSDNYRFSLMTIDLKAEGKRAKQEYSNPRRYSFYLGPDAKIKTPTDFLIKKGRVEDFEDLLSRFSIEIVTKEFFAKYKKLFEDLSYYLSSDKSFSYFAVKNQLNIEDFAKKLLGQIVFLYFLQRRGWLGAEKGKSIQQGDKNFFRNLFNKKYRDYSNFFNDILEYLFYDALNNKPQKAASFYRDYFNCQIPFLNGGLFEPLNNYDWKNEFLYIPNELFSNKEGTGILDIFDLYNFTVDENLPTEQEVSIDPEMLGKIFENLLGENLRKGKGTYYTPREIVHYMCQESLINYLITESGIKEEKIRKLVTQDPEIDVTKDIVEQIKQKSLPLSEVEVEKLDNLLKDIKVVDPACGSGAFLVGMLQLIVHCRDRLTGYFYLFGKPTNKRSEYDLKRETIQNCIYGVDIDSGAVEIAKLRLWLSLVVDHDLEEIEPLPNLDYKITQGNSLIEEFAGIRLVDNNENKNEIKKKIKELKDRIEQIKQEEKENQKKFIEIYSNKQIKDEKILQIAKQLKDREKNLEKELENMYKKLEENDAEEKEIKKLKEKLFEKQKEFFNESNVEVKNKLRKEIEDIIIEIFKRKIKKKKDEFNKKLKEIESKANNIVNNEQRVKYLENEQKKLEKQFDLDEVYEAENRLGQYMRKQERSFFPWHLYFADVFEHKGGFDIVIANPPYIDSEAMSKGEQKNLREFISKRYKMTRGNWDIYIAFFELGFNILNSKGTLVFITPDKWISKPFGATLRKSTFNQLCSILKAGRKIFETAKVDSIVSLFSKNNCQTLKIFDFKNKQIDLKQEINKETLQNISGYDYLFSNYLKFLLKIDSIQGKLIDLAECENACATSDAYKLKKIIKELKGRFDSDEYLKIINTGTIDKYVSKWGKQKMVYLKDKYLCPVINKKKFCNLFKNIYSKKSLRTKIIIKGLTLLDACLDSKGEIIPGKSTLIIADDDIGKLKFLLGIINSKLAIFFIKEKYPASSYNQGINFTKEMINNFPVPKLSDKQWKQFVNLVDKIINIKESNDYLENETKQKKVKEYEEEIDRMVYKLYCLTEKEIKIVENK